MSALERLRASVDGALWAEVESRDGDPCVEVAREHAVEVLRALRDDAGFEMATFVTAIDRSPANPRFEVVRVPAPDRAQPVDVTAVAGRHCNYSSSDPCV